MREIKDRDSKKSVVQNLKSSSENKLVDFNMKIPLRRRKAIQNVIQKINEEEQPIRKVTQVEFIMKAVALLEKRLEKSNYEDIRF